LAFSRHGNCRTVQLHQLGEKFRALFLAYPRSLHTDRELPHQSWYHRDDLAALLGRVPGLYAPDEVVHRVHGALPDRALRALLDVDQEQQLEPLFRQEIDDELGQIAKSDARPDLVFRDALAEGELLHLLDALRRLAGFLRDALVFLLEER